MQWIVQRWENKESKRYYECRLQKDLLGDWVITRNWGGINTQLGQVKHQLVESYGEGVNKVFDVAEKRMKRRYSPVLSPLAALNEDQ
jgi:predicted DNA-binding WGR domain protein